MKPLLYLSRGFGFIVSFVFLFIVVANIINQEFGTGEVNHNIWTNYFFYALVFIATFGYFLAWKHEGLGGLILTISALIISYLAKWEMGIPFFTVGQLFVLFWFLKTKNKRKQAVKT